MTFPDKKDLLPRFGTCRVADTHGRVTDDEILELIRDFHRGERLSPPAPGEAVAELEAVVGYPMPPLLRRIYLEVSDGGFTQASGALSLTEPHKWYCCEERRMLEEYLYRVSGRDPHNGELLDPYPGFLVPLEHQGCSVWAYVDWSTPEGRIWTGDEGFLVPERFTFAEELVSSLGGRGVPPVVRGDFDKELVTKSARRGRPVRVEFASEDGRPDIVRAVHDDKRWRVTSARTHPSTPSKWTTWSAVLFGPQPGRGRDGEQHVTLTPQLNTDLWWMDLSNEPRTPTDNS